MTSFFTHVKSPKYMLRIPIWLRLFCYVVCSTCFYTASGKISPTAGELTSQTRKEKRKEKRQKKVDNDSIATSLRPLDFATTGQLITSPPSYIRAGSSLTFRILVDKDAADPELIRLAKSMAVTNNMLADDQNGVKRLLTEAGLYPSSLEGKQKLATNLQQLNKQYTATLTKLFQTNKALKKALPNLASQYDLKATVASTDLLFMVAKPTYTVVFSGDAPPATQDLKVAKKDTNWHKATATTNKAGTLGFKLYSSSSWHAAIAEQLKLKNNQLPVSLQGNVANSAFNTLLLYQPLATRVARLLSNGDSVYKVATPILAAAITDANEGLKRQIGNLAGAGYQKDDAAKVASATWLLQWLWTTNGERLTITPEYKATTNRLLYQGILKISTASSKRYVGGSRPERRLLPTRPDAGRVTMRHHDAASYYALTNGRDAAASAINEEQNMSLLLYNLTDKSRPGVTITVTALDNDLETYTEQIANAANKSGFIKYDLNIGSPDSVVLKESVDLVHSFNKLRQLLVPFRDWSSWLITPSQSDTTPEFRTLELPHQKPLDAPVKVEYSIVDTMYNNNAVPGIKPFSYRQNKLYRFRFKAGIVYSWLDRKEYTINMATNTATRTTHRADPATAVGFQVFPWRLNIREQHFAFRPFLYGGFLLSGAPAKNVLLGGGFELLPGVAIIGGLHLSPGQRLIQSNGVLDTRNDTLDKAGFVQVALGLAAFNALFKIPATINNPFKVPASN